MERQTYTYDEAFRASLEYFDGDELAARVWVNKYALPLVIFTNNHRTTCIIA